jgi:hypothetical protein
VLWICLAIALVPLLVLGWAAVSLWGTIRGFFHELRELSVPQISDRR